MNNNEKIQEIYNEIINKRHFLENELEIQRRINNFLIRENQSLLNIINNKFNKESEWYKWQ